MSKQTRWTVLGLALAGILTCAPALAAPPDASGGDRGDSIGFLEDTVDDDLLMAREKYFYSSFGRRDPFSSLLAGKFASTGEGDLLDVGEMSLVGVVWGDEDKFALVQDSRDRAHTLRVGDRVVNGKIIQITRTSLTVQHYFFGETANITIYMTQGDGDDQ